MARERLTGEPPWWKHPALVLLWKRNHREPQEWVCKYFLSLPCSSFDIRAEGKCVRAELGGTNIRFGSVEKTPLEEGGTIYTPFRDGVHVKYDATALGIPAYAVCSGQIEQLDTRLRAEIPCN